MAILTPQGLLAQTTRAALAQSHVPFWDGDGSAYTATPQAQWSSWDVVYINLQPLPGRSDVRIIRRPKIKTQRRSQMGVDGDSPILIGYSPAEIEIETLI